MCGLSQISLVFRNPHRPDPSCLFRTKTPIESLAPVAVPFLEGPWKSVRAEYAEAALSPIADLDPVNAYAHA